MNKNINHVRELTKSRIAQAKIDKLAYTIEGLKEYYSSFNRKIHKDIEGIISSHKKELDAVDITNIDSIYEINSYFAEIHDDVEETILKYFHYSFIIITYSFLERAMIDLCVFIKDKNELKLTHADLRGTGITQSQKYLEKVCDINFPTESSEWKNILNFQKIRNCIVHAIGDIEKSKDTVKLKEILSNDKYLSLKITPLKYKRNISKL